MEKEQVPFNGLSAAEAERLALLMEECGEVIQACGKVLRHGYESFSHFDENKTPNRKLLLAEIGDVAAVMTLMLKQGDFPHPPTDDHIYGKIKKLAEYTHHQP